jgi:hypothetical protein
MTITLQREYRIRAESRRLSWYGIVGVSVVAATLWGMSQWELVADEIHPHPAGFAVLALVAAVSAIPLFWRLRIDDEGVARRRAFVWDFWPWSDFEAGLVYKVESARGRRRTYYDPGRPRGFRKLGLESMEDRDQVEAVRAINQRHRLPPGERIASCFLKFNRRRSVVLDDAGVHLLDGEDARDYAWSDVRLVEIVRLEPKRRDFIRARIVLADAEIRWGTIHRYDMPAAGVWSLVGEDSASPVGRLPSNPFAGIGDLLLRHAPAERTDVAMVDDVARRPAEVRRWMEEGVRQARRDLKTGPLAMAGIALFFFCWCALSGEVRMGVHSALVWLGFSVVFVPLVHRMEMQRVRALAEPIDGALDSAPSPTSPSDRSP